MRPWFENPELLKMVASAGLEGGVKLREMFNSDWAAAEQSKKADQAHQLAIRQYGLGALALAVAPVAALAPRASQLVHGEPAAQPSRFETAHGFLLRHNAATGQSCVYHSFSGVTPEVFSGEWCATRERRQTP